MADRYYKAVRPDGRDFHSGTIDYAAALASGEVVRHPAPVIVPLDASTYLSVSVAPADCTGMEWPCRLLRVEPVGDVVTCPDIPSKRAVSALRVVEELPAWMALGPNGEAVARLLDRMTTVTTDEWRRLTAAWAAAWAAWDAAWDATKAAARAAARDAARTAAREAAWEAALALVVRDHIAPSQYDLLVGPWESVMGTEWTREEADRG